MIQTVLDALRCPLCDSRLAGGGRTLTCRQGHAFDLARQGYVNLLVGNARPGTADTPAMVRAREAFLARGHYQPLAEALARTAAVLAGPATLIVDVGAGTGHYLAAALDACPGAIGLALDISKAAIRRAARAHPRAGAAVCDVWRRLPLADAAAGLLLNTFAPRNGPELRRVLDRDGALVVATPTPRHLHELVAPLGLLRVDEAKDERLARTLTPHFTCLSEEWVEHRLALSAVEVWLVAAMGPAAHHAPPGELDRRAAALTAPLDVTLSVRLAAYRPAP